MIRLPEARSKDHRINHGGFDLFAIIAPEDARAAPQPFPCRAAKLAPGGGDHNRTGRARALVDGILIGHLVPLPRSTLA